MGDVFVIGSSGQSIDQSLCGIRYVSVARFFLLYSDYANRATLLVVFVGRILRDSNYRDLTLAFSLGVLFHFSYLVGAV